MIVMARKAEFISFPMLPVHIKSMLNNAYLTGGYSQVFIKILVKASVLSFLLTLLKMVVPDALYRRGQVQ